MAAAHQHVSADRHLPQLDAVRCFAVVAVIWSHTAGQHLGGIGRADVGVFGVWLFFVLSGYLITGILLRSTPSGGEGARRRVLYVFYARRFLRIFPAYYLLLAVGALFAVSASFRTDWLWHVTYTSNWLIAITGRWGGAVGPLWSLGVEEQFYLVWPLLILTVPRRVLPVVFTALIFGALASRAYVTSAGFHNGSAVPLLTPTSNNLDPLALGALLAWAHAGHASAAATTRATRFAFIAGMCIAGYALLWSLHVVAHGRNLISITEALGGGLIGVYIVDRAARGVSREALAGRVLSAPAVQYVGRISYGIYLCHVLLLTLLRQHFRTFSAPFFATWPGYFAWFLIVGTVSVGVASASWYLYERPINSLKDRFRYPGRAHQVDAAPDADAHGERSARTDAVVPLTA